MIAALAILVVARRDKMAERPARAAVEERRAGSLDISGGSALRQ